MKKYIILCFIAIICFGCKSNKNSNKLICSINRDSEKQTIIFNYDNDNMRVLNVNVESIIDLSIYDDEFKQHLIDFSSRDCSTDNNLYCNVLIENDQIIENISKTGSEFFGDDRKSIDKVQEKYEDDGYTCEK